MANEKNDGDGGLTKFVVGLIVGVLMTSGYVKWGWKKPAILEVPEQVTSSVLAATATNDLYDLSQPLEVRLRALEVVAQQRPDEVLIVDAEELDYALLEAFYRRKARREATALSLQWSAYDVAIDKPALRDVFERKYGQLDNESLKQAMLFEAFEKEPFLKPRIDQKYKQVDRTTLLPILKEVRRHPKLVAGRELRAL